MKIKLNLFGKKSKTAKPKKQKRFQSSFRKFHNGKTTGHPSYVFGEKGKEYQTIGITTKEKTNGVLNIPLEKNPEPNNVKKAFLRPQPINLKKGTDNDVLKGWKFLEKDKQTVKVLIKKNK